MNALRQVSSPMLLRPAFGKVYLSSLDMYVGWLKGDTFRIFGGPYCSIRDIEMLRNDSSSMTLCDFRNLSVDIPL